MLCCWQILVSYVTNILIIISCTIFACSDHKDPIELRQSFGLSNEFIKSLLGNYKANAKMAQIAETQQLASCTYEDGTKWGEEVSPTTDQY